MENFIRRPSGSRSGTEKCLETTRNSSILGARLDAPRIFCRPSQNTWRFRFQTPNDCVTTIQNGHHKAKDVLILFVRPLVWYEHLGCQRDKFEQLTFRFWIEPLKIAIQIQFRVSLKNLNLIKNVSCCFFNKKENFCRKLNIFICFLVWTEIIDAFLD